MSAASQAPEPPPHVHTVVVPRWIQLVLLPLAILGAWATLRAAGPVVLLFTIAGLIGYRRFRDGRRPEAAAWLGAYSVSGLISVLHYTDISPADLSAFQNTFVFADVVLGGLVLAYAVWLAVRPPVQLGV